MNTSLFSKLCWPGQHNFEKREIGVGGGVPRTAASAALSWAIIELPLRGVGRSRQEASIKTLDWMTRSTVTLLQFGRSQRVLVIGQLVVGTLLQLSK